MGGSRDPVEGWGPGSSAGQRLPVPTRPVGAEPPSTSTTSLGPRPPRLGSAGEDGVTSAVRIRTVVSSDDPVTHPRLYREGWARDPRTRSRRGCSAGRGAGALRARPHPFAWRGKGRGSATYAGSLLVRVRLGANRSLSARGHSLPESQPGSALAGPCTRTRWRPMTGPCQPAPEGRGTVVSRIEGLAGSSFQER